MKTADTQKRTGINIREFAIEGTEVPIDDARILHVLGYPKNYMTDQLRSAIDLAKEKVFELCERRCGFGYVHNSFSISDGGFTTQGVTFAAGNIITTFLRRCSGIAFFAGTIGPFYERWIRHCFEEGEPLLGMVGDVIASELAEQTADHVEARIAEFAAQEGLMITNRYSPGYCGWSVAEQHKLFSFLPPKFCGITLNESALMIPMKSVSGIIGVGKKVVKQPYTCDACGLEHCVYRREKESA